jgi:hypothetical protein
MGSRFLSKIDLPEAQSTMLFVDVADFRPDSYCWRSAIIFNPPAYACFQLSFAERIGSPQVRNVDEQV